MQQTAASGAGTYSSAIGEALNYTRWVLDAFDGLIGRRVLEIGIGHGGYVDHLPQCEAYLGVDIDADSVAAARVARPKYEYLQADVAAPDFLKVLGERRFDTVLCLNVLEHIEDHGLAVANLLKTLQSGGHLLLFVPAFEALYSPLDRFAGHYRRYTRKELAQLIPVGAGQVVRNEYFNPIGGIGWWANKFMPHKSLNDGAVNGQVRLFDRYVLPISRRLNPLTRTIFGQSVVFAVRRP
jgi:2-polyprenyl-3-methyl-5-hydroxy-6-metoxy-1,4-benzoquinol methylase